MKLTIICYNQFGYLTDTFEYCKYLRKRFEIEYVCIDQGYDRISLAGVHVKYLETSKVGYKKWLEFYIFSKGNISKNTDVVFIKYFLFCSFLTFPYRNKAILDVRTGSIKPDRFKRFIENILITVESRVFRFRTIISHSLAKLIHYPKYKLLPLGAPVQDMSDKKFDCNDIRLLYIGTFSGRRIEEVLAGLALFIIQKGKNKNIFFDIVGDGYNGELDELKLLAIKLGLKSNVFFHGRVPYKDTKIFLENSNVGISYVPKTSFFNVQPVTKTFEYLSAGMAVIGTSTSEQSIVLASRSYGELCNDTPESFSLALEELVSNFDNYSSSNIKAYANRWAWSKICADLEIYIDDVIEKNKIN